eukprot:Tamp_23100.p1 GENE.Tamp_23100~~Tamp_23100.p1  ORF type:complete len:327 (+),score=67.58 Tamp_23100:73-981(+)
MAAAGAEGPGEEIRAALQRGRRWSAWALRWPGACPGAVDCAVVEQALREELRGFFQDFAVAAAAAGVAGDRIALRVAITERASARSAQRKTSTVYLVHFLRSDLVLASALKAEYVEYLKHALCRALGCCSVADRGLSARQVDALKELVLAPACTPDLVDAIMADDAAVTGRPHRRARDTSSTASAGTQHDAVVDDSAPAEGFAKRARDRAPRMPQHAASDKPALLEHICIRVTEACGEHALKLTLSGPDVLQGVRDLAQEGILNEPPEPLRNLVLGIGVPSNEMILRRSQPSTARITKSSSK